MQEQLHELELLISLTAGELVDVLEPNNEVDQDCYDEYLKFLFA